LLLARTKEKLDEVKAEISKGGKASVFPCDLNDMESIDAVSKKF
jgi:short-subunit dehydrogenase